MVKKSLITILLSLTLIACSTSLPKPKWFEMQGVNISECGPATAANAINWAGGSTNRYKTRDFNTDRSWWLLSDIYSTISKHGINVKYTNIADINIIKNTNSSGVFYINRNHFILVDYINGKWVKYDPISGVKETDLNYITSRSWSTFILVKRY